MSCSNQYPQHSFIPHSKSLDHYNESAKFGEQHYHASRHSFDQPISSNYKNYDCIDGIHATDRNNGCHYSSIVGNHQYQSSKYNLANTDNAYNVSGNRAPLPTTLSEQSHHYSQIEHFDRGENFSEPNHSSCCQNYDYLLNGRNAQVKPKNTDYSNCNLNHTWIHKRSEKKTLHDIINPIITYNIRQRKM